MPAGQLHFITLLTQVSKCEADELACKPDTDAPSAGNHPRGGVGRKSACGVAPRWLCHPCPATTTSKAARTRGRGRTRVTSMIV